jgi:tetratricopeptide (TPR) repeat protein
MGDEPTKSASGSRRTKMAIGVVAIAVGAAAVGVVAGKQLQSPADAAAAAKAPEASRITVPVEKRTLVSRLIANGDVQYTEPTNLRLAGSVGASGGAIQIVTKAPEANAPLAEGDVIMEVSGRPIFAFQGSLPTYRPLEPGSKGPDVQQLEEALARLGTFGGSPDDTYDNATESALDLLYMNNGYASEGPTDEQRVRQRAAEKAVADATTQVTKAQQDLAKGGESLTPSQLLGQQQQLQNARDAVPAAQAAAARRNADAVAAITAATATRDLALTARNNAKAAKDAATAPDAVNPDTGLPYTNTELAIISDALANREAALVDAEAALRTAISNRDQAAVDGAKEVKTAQDAQALAELQYAEAVAPKDTQMLREAVKTAQDSLKQANQDLAAVQADVGTKMPAGEMIFLPSLPTTITSVSTVAGQAPADPFATASGTETTIQGRISATDADLVVVPADVDIQLRDADIVTTGTLIEISKPKAGGGNNNGGFGGGGSGDDGSGRLVIVVRPSDPTTLANYVGFPARITITVSSTAGAVLAVPVAAISVGADGESRVEVERSKGDGPDATEMVKVTVGLTAEGYAEITPIGGAELDENDRVVVGKNRSSG